jgi:anti-sigma regulatory factor (Ser/Thr protein kinase)
MLWQAFKSCKNAGIDFDLISPSTEMVRILDVLDLNDHFISKSTSYKMTGYAYKNVFKADVNSINKALDEFIISLSNFKLKESVTLELKTIFYEIATNIRQHASSGEDELVIFSSKADNNKITLVFEDSSVPFDPEEIETLGDFKSAARNKQVRGLGLSMVRKLSDNMSYIRKYDVINVLTIEKNWSERHE